MIENLVPVFYDNPMVLGLSDKPRKYTAVEASEIVTKMTIDKPVSEWKQTMDELDI